MPRQFTKAIDLYEAQVDRFAKFKFTALEMHEQLANSGLADWYELTAGTPIGNARRNLLARLGHPFGRGESAGASTATGRRRGTRSRMVSRFDITTAKAAPENRVTWGYEQSGKERLAANGLSGELPLLPIGQISGRLRKSIKKRKVASPGHQTFSVGAFDPGPSGWVLAIGGTRRMVSRGIEKEIRRRWRPRNKALLDALAKRQTES